MKNEEMQETKLKWELKWAITNLKW